MAGIRIYTRFYDITGMPWAVTVWDTYTTPSSSLEIPMGADPIVIRWSGDGIKYIVGSEVTLTWVTSEDMSWLRTATTDQFVVIVWKNPTVTNGVWSDIYKYYTDPTVDRTKIWWVGFVLADSYSKELRIDATYSIQATDRLGSLANYDYIDLTGTPPGEVSHGLTPTPTNRHQRVLTSLANALQSAGIFLPIVSAVNLYEEGMDATDDDDPLDQLYIDELNFCDEDLALGDCYTVVDKIMRIFKSRIFQSGGFWFVQRIEDFKNPEVAYRVFTFGNGYPYSYHSTTSHVKTVNKTDFAVLFCGVEEVSPAYKKIDVTQNYGKLISMFPGFTFEDQEFDMGVPNSDPDLAIPPKPIHWQYSEQLDENNPESNFRRYPIGDNWTLISRSNVSNLTIENRGYLESPHVPMSRNGFDGLLLQMDTAYVWSGVAPPQSLAAHSILIKNFSIQIFFVEDDNTHIWAYKRQYEVQAQTESLPIGWERYSVLESILTANFTSIENIPAVESLENLEKVELFIPPLPSTATQGKLFLRIIDPNTNYGYWGLSYDAPHFNYYLHLCVDNVILLYAPKPSVDPLGPCGVYRYYETKLTTTVIKAENRVNVSYPLDLGDSPSDFTTDEVNKFQAYSGLLNLSSTDYEATSLWYEKYITNGVVTSSEIVSGGSGYSVGQLLMIDPTENGMLFSASITSVNPTNGAVTGYTMSSGGSGFITGTYRTYSNKKLGYGCTISITGVEIDSVTSDSDSLINWIIKDYEDNETPSMIVRASIRGAADYVNTVQFYTVSPTAIFLPQDVSFNIKSTIWEGNWIEIKGMMIPIEYTSEVEPRKSLQK